MNPYDEWPAFATLPASTQAYIDQRHAEVGQAADNMVTAAIDVLAAGKSPIDAWGILCMHAACLSDHLDPTDEHGEAAMMGVSASLALRLAQQLSVPR